MKAAVLRDLARPMEIEDISIAKPMGREVLVRMKAVGLCHSDLHVLDGRSPYPLPIVLGHEAAGVVEAVGDRVSTVRRGDHVVVCLAFHCGHCDQCESGHSNRCFTPEAQRAKGEPPRIHKRGEPLGQFSSMGAFAEQILVHESGCVRIRDDMPLDRACLIGCGVTTGAGAAIRTAGVQPGQSVVVIGCGGVGLSAINGALIAGAGRILAVDVQPMKLDLARQFGATDAIDGSAGGVVERVMALTGGRGVDHAIEAIGIKQTIEDGFRMLAKGGALTVIGVPAGGAGVEFSPMMLLAGERRVQGSMLGGVRTAIDIPRYVDLYLQGRLRIDQLISKRIRLAEINEAFDELRGGKIARSVIVFD